MSVHYHSNGEELRHSRTYWAKTKLKPNRANSKSCIFMFDVKGFSSSSFAECNIPHTLLGWFHFLSAELLGRYPTVLTSPTPCSLQHNPDSTFTASYEGLSGPPHRHSTATYLASAALNYTLNPTPVPFMTLKLEPHGRSCQVLCLLRIEPSLLLELHSHKICFVVFLLCTNLPLYSREFSQ